MPYGDIELNQWLDSGKVFLPDDTKPLPESVSSVSSSNIDQRAISHEILFQPSDTKISLQITYLQFHSNLPGANELSHYFPKMEPSEGIITTSVE